MSVQTYLDNICLKIEAEKMLLNMYRFPSARDLEMVTQKSKIL